MEQNVTPGPAKVNRRNYPRAPFSIRVQYGAPNGPSREGYSGILGGGGIFVETVKPLPTGRKILLEFSLPAIPSPIRLEGLVVWVRSEFYPAGMKPGMGIEFKKISEDDRYKILDLVMRVLMGEADIDQMGKPDIHRPGSDQTN